MARPRPEEDVLEDYLMTTLFYTEEGESRSVVQIQSRTFDVFFCLFFVVVPPYCCVMFEVFAPHPPVAPFLFRSQSLFSLPPAYLSRARVKRTPLCPEKQRRQSGVLCALILH